MLDGTNFDQLARAYVCASDDVDNFDLHSEDPESVKQFEKLEELQNYYKKQIFDLAVKNFSDFKMTF